MLHYLLPLAVVALSGAPNLLDNSGFEMDGTAGWKFSLPAGTSGDADADVAHAGKAACRLTIPESAAVTWYMASREALPAKRGASQVVSAYAHKGRSRRRRGLCFGGLFQRFRQAVGVCRLDAEAEGNERLAAIDGHGAGA